MRNLLTIIFFITGLVLFVQLIQAKTADDIIARYNEARGGIEALRKIHSVYIEGIRHIMEQVIPIRIYKINDVLCRTEFDVFEGTGFVEIREDSGRSFIPKEMEGPKPLSEEELSSNSIELNVAGPFVDYSLKGYVVDKVGKEDINGNECYKIRMTFPTGKNIFYYFDVYTKLLVQSREVKFANNQHSNRSYELITTYADYRQVDGLLFPFVIINDEQSFTSGKTIFNRIILNQEVALT